MKENKMVGYCQICGSELFDGEESAKWVYHVSRGLVCRHHPGVMEWYNALLKQAEEDLRKIYAIE